MGLSLLFHVYKIVDIKECEIIFIYLFIFVILLAYFLIYNYLKLLLFYF